LLFDSANLKVFHTESVALQKPPTGKPYNTRAAALTANGSRSASQQRSTNAKPAKTQQSGKVKNKEPTKDAVLKIHLMPSDPLKVIEEALLSILDREKMEQTTRTLIGRVLMFIRETVLQDKKSKMSIKTQPEVSDLQKAIKLDLFRMYDALLEIEEVQWGAAGARQRVSESRRKNWAARAGPQCCPWGIWTWLLLQYDRIVLFICIICMNSLGFCPICMRVA
jgi:hypothetical protein